MKLGVSHPSFEEIGAAELLAVSQARCLRTHGFDVGIRTFVFDPNRWAPRVGSVPVEALHLSLPERPRPMLTGGLQGQAAKWATRSFAEYDAVIAHNFPTNAILGRADYAGGKIWYCHGPTPDLHGAAATPNLASAVARGVLRETRVGIRYQRDQLLRRALGRIAPDSLISRAEDEVRGVAGVHAIWANSAYTRDSVRRIHGERAVEIVPPIVDFPAAARHRSGIDRSGLRILTMARLEPTQNVETILRAFALFLNDSPDAALEIVGDGSERPHLVRLARRLRLEANVTFHGVVDPRHLDRIFARCDAFALLPIDEPFGLDFAEAAARGLILIGPDHGGPSEILDGGALGLTVDAFSPEAAAEALRRVSAMSDAETDELRRRADAACRARYDRSIVGPQMVKLLAQLGLVGESRNVVLSGTNS